MIDGELKTHLNRLEMPKPSEEARKRAFNASIEALKTGSEPASAKTAPTAPIHYPWKLAGIAAGCAALLAGFLLLIPKPGAPPGDRADPPPEQADPYASERRVFGELDELFAGALAAIVLENGESRIMINDDPSQYKTGRGEPVVMRFSSGEKAIRYIGFSGQEVDVELDGRRYIFELLLSGQDEIILVAEDFIWTPSQPFPVEGVQATAAPLKRS